MLKQAGLKFGGFVEISLDEGPAVTRFLIKAPFFIAVAGCSHREEIPKFTQVEWDEVRRHFPRGDEPRDDEYFASAEGRRLVAKSLRSIFGDLGLATLKSASRVEAFRIVDLSSHSVPKHTIGAIEGFPIIARGKDQGQEFASKLSDHLLKGELYFQGYD